MPTMTYIVGFRRPCCLSDAIAQEPLVHQQRPAPAEVMPGVLLLQGVTAVAVRERLRDDDWWVEGGAVVPREAAALFPANLWRGALWLFLPF